MSKEEYEKLQKIVDEIFTKGEPKPPEDGTSSPILELEPLPEYSFEPYYMELATILESRIFSNGQLGGATGYDRFYQITDLVEFIWLLCDKIHSYSPSDESHHTAYVLHNLVKAIDNAKIEIRYLFGKHESTQINALKGKIEAWLKTSKDSPPQSIFIPTERELSDFIIALFEKHIPGVPELIIFERVSKLLNFFGIKVNPKTLNMRHYRKQKALPKK